MPVAPRVSLLAKSFLFAALALAVALGAGCASTIQSDEQSKPGDVDRALDDAFGDPFLAHDAKTGEYLGVVVSECRDWATKKPISYKVRLQNGSEVERAPSSITINSP